MMFFNLLLRAKRVIRHFALLAIGFLAISLNACSTTNSSGVSAIDARAKDLLTVDCLLPPQVRQLGKDVTYLGPRRPLRTSGAQCAMRGGEYVAYDRADFKSALAVWLPLAENGDPQAQTYVGEIYEKGMGTKASYVLAAAWYKRAAEQNYSRAQINLGYLFESGLGVKQDLTNALNLYRQASGFTAAELEFVSSVEIARREATLLDNERLQSDVLMLQARIDNGRQELNKRTSDLQKSQQEIVKLRGALTKQFENSSQTKTDSIPSLNQSAQTVQSLQHELIARGDDLDQQKKALAQLRDELSQWQARLPPDAVERTTETVPKGPIINVINPPLLSTHGTQALSINDYGPLNLIGRIEPIENLYLLQLNGRDLPVTTTGMFRYSTESEAPKTLDLLAVDNQGLSTRLAISVSPAKEPVLMPEKHNVESATEQATPGTSLNEVDFGDYYALVVGNNTYEHMNNLSTAGNDAVAIERILREKYGFRTTLLLDVDQKSLLTALERIRATLGKNDNLVIYYAGHGELDESSGRGYWLPTDANASNKDKWIANSAITAMIDLIDAKHVLVIADSCYSGTLTRSSVARSLPETNASIRLKWLKAVSQARVRTVLSSGSVKPLLDTSQSSEHSVFAEKLIDVLQQNTEVLEAYELFFRLQTAVVDTAAKLSVQQIPQYAPIRHAGHQAGEFIFLPSAQMSVGSENSR